MLGNQIVRDSCKAQLSQDLSKVFLEIYKVLHSSFLIMRKLSFCFKDDVSTLNLLDSILMRCRTDGKDQAYCNRENPSRDPNL